MVNTPTAFAFMKKSDKVSELMSVVQNRVLRTILFSAGAIALALGIIGAFLPILPTTPFVLLAAWCFLKSSPRAHQWLYRQPLIGEALRNWEQHRAISRRAKISAISIIAISAIVIGFKVQIMWVKAVVLSILTAVSAFIVTRNENS